MIESEADRIIEKIFGKRWPRWEMDPEEIKLWRLELMPCEFNAAVQAINNFYMSVSTGVKPQAAKLCKALRAALPEKKKGPPNRNDPVHLFSIVKEALLGTVLARRGYRYAANENDLPEDEQALVECSEHHRKRVSQMKRGEKMVVLAEWGPYYEDGKLLEKDEYRKRISDRQATEPKDKETQDELPF